MSTRSLIGYTKNLNNRTKITYVYCHFDGYPSGVGQTLVENYNTEEKIKELVSKGDLSSLGKTLESSEFYIDRGEDFSQIAPKCVSKKEFSGEHSWIDYVYVFCCNQMQWKMKSRTSKRFVQLIKKI